MAEWVCTVCGEPVDESNSWACNSCGERFHLVLKRDQPGKDCGEVWVNQQYLSLEFACRNCLSGGGEAAVGRQRRARRIRPRGTGKRRYRRR